jgi:pSer/pThr/pTyr-binding forkhead associated (FHA) protein
LFYLFHVNTYKYVDIKPGFVVGRTTGDLVIPNSSLSGKHAQFLVEVGEDGPGLFIEDLGSKNRTIVNRSEIIPGHKIRLSTNSLIELGGQSFVVTDNRNLNIQMINEIIDSYANKAIIRLEGVKIVQEMKDKIKDEMVVLEDNQTNIVQDVVEKESLLLKLQQDLSTVDDHTKNEIKKLQEIRARLITEGEEKKKSLDENIERLKQEIEAKKAEIQRIRTEVELKKKKIINLKAVADN